LNLTRRPLPYPAQDNMPFRVHNECTHEHTWEIDMSNAYTKESLEKFNREQLVHVILIEQRQAAIRESCVKNLEVEMERQQKEFSDTIQKFHWSHNAHDADKMKKFLLELLNRIRIVLGVENIRYGISNMAAGWNALGDKKLAKPDEKIQALAQTMVAVYSYFGWDDE